MRRQIAFRSDTSQVAVNLDARRDVMFFPRPFDHCIFDDQGRLFGVELGTDQNVWMCDPANQWHCRPLSAFKGARSVGSLAVLDGHVIVSVAREGDPFRRIYRIAPDGDALEPAPGVPAVDADVLDWDGVEARVGRNGREWLASPGASEAMIYASRAISGRDRSRAMWLPRPFTA